MEFESKQHLVFCVSGNDDTGRIRDFVNSGLHVFEMHCKHRSGRAFHCANSITDPTFSNARSIPTEFTSGKTN